MADVLFVAIPKPSFCRSPSLFANPQNSGVQSPLARVLDDPINNRKKGPLWWNNEPPHIVRTVQKRGLQGIEQANQRLAWRSESGARPVFVWSRSWL